MPKPDIRKRTFTITLAAAPIPNDERGIHRLRRLLKRLGRQYGMRVVRIEEITPASPHDKEATHETA